MIPRSAGFWLGISDWWFQRLGGCNVDVHRPHIIMTDRQEVSRYRRKEEEERLSVHCFGTAGVIKRKWMRGIGA